MSYAYDTMDSPVGRLTLVASDEGLCAVLWEKEGDDRVPLPATREKRPDHPILTRTRAQLAEYFDGKRTAFELPLAPEGTTFQKKAWQALRAIPYGETISYGTQASRIGAPKAARAVGAANGRNPLSIVVPCHRVIGGNGSLTGFGGGLDVKRFLLEMERRNR